jgi:hypothetical protein
MVALFSRRDNGDCGGGSHSKNQDFRAPLRRLAMNKRAIASRRAYDVRLKRNTRVAGRKVPCNPHLSDVSDGVTKQED